MSDTRRWAPVVHRQLVLWRGRSAGQGPRSLPRDRCGAGARGVLPPPLRQVKSVARGSFGFVLLALDRDTNTHVALKFIERGPQVRQHGAAGPRQAGQGERRTHHAQ